MTQEDSFASLSGGRVVRIAVHPDLQHMGYGSRAIEMLSRYYSGDLADGLKKGAKKKQGGATSANSANSSAETLLTEQIAPRSHLPPLLLSLTQRPAESLQWLGTSFGLTEALHGFWHKCGFVPVNVRQARRAVVMPSAPLVCRGVAGISPVTPLHGVPCHADGDGPSCCCAHR